MKLIKKSQTSIFSLKKCLLSFCLIFLSLNLSQCFELRKQPDILQYNQLLTYPNTHEAPTMKEQLSSANFTAPWLSRALFEEDPRRKLRLKEFISSIRYSMYKLTRGETEQMFVFVDKNHDDLVDQNEWDAFAALFIFPFEACDTDGNYILSVEEFKACWDADPRSKLVDFRRRYEEKKYELIMDVVQTRGKSEINFSDYLLIRRALFAWKECHSGDKYIALTAFKCALRTAVPNKYHLKIDHERIYKAGIKLSNDPNLIEMDYVSYFRIIYYTYVFTVFGQPHDIPWLERVQFIKAVREDRLPTNFQESEINILYDLINTNPFQKDLGMGFESWCFFFNLHRLFNKYSIEKPLQLNENELYNLLDDWLSPYAITLSIDLAKTNFTESQYLEVSMVLQRLRLNERDFYFSFKEKQDASVRTNSTNDPSTINADFYDKQANSTNRHFFFTSLVGIDKRFLTKEQYYRGFQWANLFTELAVDKRWLVSTTTFVEKLPTMYDTVHPPISQLNRNNYVMYKTLPREIHIDILTFLALENYPYKFQIHKLNSNELINETLLKIILKDYGMINMPDTVIDLAKKGFDSLRRRVYIPREVIKYVIIVHASAGESVRNNEYLDMFGLKINSDYSRRFPNFSRKFMASALV
jgi:hypothetical protein